MFNRIGYGIVSLLGLTASAQAAVDITFYTSMPSGYQLYDLDSDIGKSDFNVNGVNFDFAGNGAGVFAASDQIWGVQSAPGATQAFVVTQPGTFLTLTYSTPQTTALVKFYTLDGYNGVQFGNQKFTGAQLSALSGVADNGVNTLYARFTDLEPYKIAQYTSTGVAFEGNPGAPVPELSTWAMFGIGLAFLGFTAFRKNEKNRLSVAV